MRRLHVGVALSRDEKKPPRITLIAQNRRAGFDYELMDKFEAGVALLGTEVKVLRNGKADLSDAWVSLDGQEAFARGINIPVLEGSPFSHEPKRPRKLLLHLREIELLKRGTEREGMTVTVTKIYFKDNKIKVEVALARGKKSYDKRETLKRKEADKEAKKALSASLRRSR
jgi:SsrA-binding protein